MKARRHEMCHLCGYGIRKGMEVTITRTPSGARRAAHTDCREAEEKRRIEEAYRTRRDCWVPASGGAETPFTKNGRRYLYCFNPATGKHGYLNLDTDRVQDTLEDTP